MPIHDPLLPVAILHSGRSRPSLDHLVGAHHNRARNFDASTVATAENIVLIGMSFIRPWSTPKLAPS